VRGRTYLGVAICGLTLACAVEERGGAGQACFEDGRCEASLRCDLTTGEPLCVPFCQGRCGTWEEVDCGQTCLPGEGCNGAGLCLPAELVWVALPGGTYTMGSTAGDMPDARPLHEVRVPAFRLGRTEVTVAQYRACVDAGACGVPSDPNPVFACNFPREDREDHPINCVTWEQARAFCAFAGGRLPSEAEWEYAARGLGREVVNPWGDAQATCALAVMDEGSGVGCGLEHTWPVCSKPAGLTPQGLCDMLGNAGEWLEDAYHDSYTGAPADGAAWLTPETATRATRGGSFQSERWEAQLARRGSRDPIYPNGGSGLRCAAEQP
jgi:formylglycine-generating enzyme